MLTLENFYYSSIKNIKNVIWKLKFWKLNLKFGVLKILIWKKTRVLKIIWKLEFWKLNLKIQVLKIKVLKIKLENWSFENYLKIKFWHMDER